MGAGEGGWVRIAHRRPTHLDGWVRVVPKCFFGHLDSPVNRLVSHDFATPAVRVDDFGRGENDRPDTRDVTQHAVDKKARREGPEVHPPLLAGPTGGRCGTREDGEATLGEKRRHHLCLELI